MNDLREASIGIFDSGFGGLTVMRAIKELLPHENILYFGDTARLPYGAKSGETILRYSLESAELLASRNIKLLVIACNTASCIALEAIRSHLGIPVIGVTEQGIEEVLRLLPEGRVGLLGTKATISSGIYQKQLLTRSPKIQLFPISCPLLVPLVEEGYIDHALSQLIAHEYLAPLKIEHVEGVLLGCTHYPLLRSTIQSTLGDSVLLIDPAKACAKKTKEALESYQLINPSLESPHYQFLVSDDPEKFRLLGRLFLSHPIEHVAQTQVKHSL